MSRPDRERILERIRRAAVHSRPGRQTSRFVDSRERLDSSRALSVLEESCRTTGTFLRVLEAPQVLGDALLERIEQLGAGKVFIYTRDIPGGEDLPSQWKSFGEDQDPGAVRFIPEKEVDPPDPGEIARADACVTGCRALVGEGGICIVDSAAAPGRLGSLLPPHHIVVSRRTSLFPGLAEAMEILGREGELSGGSTVLISGPSRTADIEKKLVIGVHGPVTLSLFLLP